MSDIIITTHAYRRAKQRLGWNKKAIKRMAHKAYIEGVGYDQAARQIKTFISNLQISYIKDLDRDDKTVVKIHGEVIYFFITNRLVTLYIINRGLLKYLNKKN